MTESDLLQVALNASGTLLNIFSLFFAIVSAYVAVLYLFLYKAPNTLKLSAFLLLTLAFIFIAAMGWNLQYIGEGIHHAWGMLSKRATGMVTLGPPLIVRIFFVNSQVLTAWVAWGIGFIVYILLGYLTFFYRWTHVDE